MLYLIKIRLKLQLRAKGYYVISVLFMVILALMLKETPLQSTNQIPVIIVDQDHSTYSGLIIDRFSKKEGIKVEISTESVAKEKVKNYQAELGFIIRKGFESSVKSLRIEKRIELLKNPGSLSYGIIGEMLVSEVLRLEANDSAADKVQALPIQSLVVSSQPSSWEQVWQETDSLGQSSSLIKLDYRIENIPIETTNEIYHPNRMVGFILLALMLFTLHSGYLFQDDQIQGIVRRGASIDAFSIRYFMATVIPYLIIGCLQFFLFIVILYGITGSSIFVKPSTYFILGSYLIALVGIGTVCSLMFTKDQLASIVPILTIGSSFIGGCFWPVPPDNSYLDMISFLTPQGWALKGFLYESQVIKVSVILIGIGVFLLIISAGLLRKKQSFPIA
ncbi:MAG TPA: ABC transporter permease [Bacillota bacterium]|nr:ABC transporter permease [Bacillota bacterium]